MINAQDVDFSWRDQIMTPKKYFGYLSWLLLGISLSSWGCSSDTDPISISSGSEIAVPPLMSSAGIQFSPETIYRGNPVRLGVEFFDPDSNAFTLTWSASGGTIIPGDAGQAQWIAPLASGRYEITVRVEDDNGGVDSRSLDLPVTGQGWVVAEPTSQATLLLPDGYQAGQSAQTSRGIRYLAENTAQNVNVLLLFETATQQPAEGDLSDFMTQLQTELSTTCQRAGIVTPLHDQSFSFQMPNGGSGIRKIWQLQPQTHLTLAGLNQIAQKIVTGDSPSSTIDCQAQATEIDGPLGIAMMIGQDSLGHRLSLLALADLRREPALIRTDLDDLTNGTALLFGPAEFRLTEEKKIPQLLWHKTDFLWVMDNSGSMDDEQNFVAKHTAHFFDILNSFGFDFRLGVITTDNAALQGSGFTTSKEEFAANVKVGTAGSGMEQGLFYGRLALEPATDIGIRPDAAIALVMMSDEEDSSPDAVSAYEDFFNALSARVFALVTLPVSEENPVICGTSPGTRYIEVAQATGGDFASICASDTDAENLFTQIARASGITQNEYHLLQRPISSTIEIWVDEQKLIRDQAWWYQAADQTVHFQISAIPRLGSLVRLHYEFLVGR
jgi:hypothetical protein